MRYDTQTRQGKREAFRRRYSFRSNKRTFEVWAVAITYDPFISSLISESGHRWDGTDAR